MIYDCFTFFNELDVLEIRLNVLNEAVDRFVLVEATRTHHGEEKPLLFAANKSRFAPFLDKIVHIVVDDFAPVEEYIASPSSNPKKWSWAYENHQRHEIVRGLVRLKDDDVVIVSDLDEIPTVEAVRKAARLSADGKVRFLQLSHRSFFLNFCNFSMPKWEWGPIVLSGKAFRDPQTYAKVWDGDSFVREVISIPSPQLVRVLKPDRVVRNAGWHFSFMGGMDMIMRKLASFAHTEYSGGRFADPKHVSRVIENGGDLFGVGDRYYAIPARKCLPPFILDNLQKYGALVYPTSGDYLRKTRLRKLGATLFYFLRTITPGRVKDIIYRFIRSRAR